MNNQELIKKSAINIKGILDNAIEHDPSKSKSLVIFDTDYGLTQILTEAYKLSLPDAKFIDFNTIDKEKAIAIFDNYVEGDLIVLIQSSNFRLNDFRIRMNLFNKKNKVIEHAHLYRNLESVWDVYIDSLEYDMDWYRGVGHKIKSVLSNASKIKIVHGESILEIDSALEEPKLNIGDYAGMKNIGGSFPIGEVFTESKDLSKVNGTLVISSFADQSFTLEFYEPFEVEIQEGIVVGWSKNTPQKFIDIIEYVKTFERPILREFGFGMNRAITTKRPLGDITAFERKLGLHVSLGEKHSVYSKNGISKTKAKFHIDLYLEVDEVIANNTTFFKNGNYLIV